MNKKPSGKSPPAQKNNKNNRGKATQPKVAGSKKALKVSKSTTNKGKAKTVKKKKKDKGKAKTVKKKKKESKIAKISNYKRKGWAYRLVKTGKKAKTSGGLTKQDLMYNANGRVVSKKRSKHSKKLYVDNHLDLWAASLVETRAKFGVTGFLKVKKTGDATTTSLHKQMYALWQKKLAEKMGKIVSSAAGGDEFRAEMNGYLKGHGLVLNDIEKQPTVSSTASGSKE